jgi:D-arabinose 1-dehydrogenase-like Zn-dependent alcohol dehydrogenase
MIVFCGTVTDVAGEIAEVGTEVRELKVGDKVVSKLKFWVTSNLLTCRPKVDMHHS